MDIGSLVAGDRKHSFNLHATEQLERQIDLLDNVMPPLKNFIVPGSSNCAQKLHFARAVVRRAERVLVTVDQFVADHPEALAYVNRLSDYLFVQARYKNFCFGQQDEIYRPFAE
jgi:cob(I)alamin adenosyltransferase